jgi:hypothetical protein
MTEILSIFIEANLYGDESSLRCSSKSDCEMTIYTSKENNARQETKDWSRIEQSPSPEMFRKRGIETRETTRNNTPESLVRAAP